MHMNVHVNVNECSRQDSSSSSSLRARSQGSPKSVIIRREETSRRFDEHHKEMFGLKRDESCRINS